MGSKTARHTHGGERVFIAVSHHFVSKFSSYIISFRSPQSMLVVASPSDESNKCRLNTQQSPTLAPATTSPVAITCMDHGGGMGAYADSDTEVMVMGSESGDLYVLPTRGTCHKRVRD